MIRLNRNRLNSDLLMINKSNGKVLRAVVVRAILNGTRMMVLNRMNRNMERGIGARVHVDQP